MKIDKVKRLQEKAALFRLLLENYASKDHEVAELLKRLTPLFKRVEKGKVIPPKSEEFRVYDYARHYPCLTSNHALGWASASFAMVLEDGEYPREDGQDPAGYLRERVQPFRKLLERYAEKDEAARQLFMTMKPLLDDINDKKSDSTHSE